MKTPKALWKRVLRVFAPAVLSAASLTGCISVGVQRAAGSDPQARLGTLEVSVYDSPKQKKAGVLTQSGAYVELLRLDQGLEKSLEVFATPSWSKAGLEPGTYRLRVRKQSAAPAAEAAKPRGTPIDKDLRVGAGETVHADIVLKKFPTTTVLIASGVVVAGMAVAVATAPVVDFKSGTTASKCVRRLDPKKEIPPPELPPLFDLVRPLPHR
jgi:hypothetical protein